MWFLPTFLDSARMESGRLFLASGLRQPSYGQRVLANIRAMWNGAPKRADDPSELERALRKANPEKEGQTLHALLYAENQFYWFCANPGCRSASFAWTPPCLVGLADAEIGSILEVAMRLANPYIYPRPDPPVYWLMAERDGGGGIQLTANPFGRAAPFPSN